MLADEGTTILKFFLHISKDEQKQRLEARLDDPDKNWKFNPGDLEERKHWDDYQEAYEDVLEKCSTDARPVVRRPGGHASGSATGWCPTSIVRTLKSLAPRPPPPPPGISRIRII